MHNRIAKALLTGVALIMSTACAGTTTAEAPPSTSPSPTSSAPGQVATTEAPPSASPSPTSSAPGQVATAGETQLARDFVAFALRPSANTAARLRFASAVRLGLGPQLVTTVNTSAITEDSAWVLTAKSFRGSTGAFSALRLIRKHAQTTGSQSFTGETAAFQVSIGEHPHCAAAPVAPPAQLATLRRVSIQPTSETMDSCLSWFTVDLFVTTTGKVAAVTLDLWEP